MDYPATKKDIARLQHQILHNTQRIIKVNLMHEIVSLQARMKKARQYPYNTALQLEAELCEAQILALTERLERYND